MNRVLKTPIVLAIRVKPRIIYLLPEEQPDAES
jgi:hypothetical protein